MKPAEFLKVALTLSVRPTEAERRTAVSRAYYASFHLALYLLDADCGVIVPVHEAHVKLAHCLQNVPDVDEAREAGRLLDSLRQARRIADYELNHASPSQPAWATHHIRQTQSLVNALQLCAKEPRRTQVAARVRSYAQGLLGWGLRQLDTR